MSFAKLSSFRRTLAFRLAYRHTLVFAFFALATFWIFYAARRSMLQYKTDAYLLAPARGCARSYTQGLPELQTEIETVTDAVGTHDILLRLLAADGQVVASSDDTAWKELGVDRNALARAQPAAPVFSTVSSGLQNPARVLYYATGEGHVVQAAVTLSDDLRLLKEFRLLFGMAIAVVTLLGGVMSWLATRHALAKVEAVTRTATVISSGALDSRVPVTPAADEIDRLASAFNQMLDRIQTLLRNLREISDNLAHELRSPITRIRGGAETTLTGSEDIADYKSMAASTVEECDQLLGLINTMLDISEAEAGVVKLKPAELNLAKTVGDVCDLFRPVAEDKAVVIREEVPEVCRVRGDREKIQRSLANLLDNAIKYSHPKGSVTVSLREEGTTALISVKDTGSGISPQDMPHIFERFYRSDTSRSEPGNGLGLSLARALVRAHGGDISVESAPGAGSTFVLALPKASA